jgi:hypothetical protein
VTGPAYELNDSPVNKNRVNSRNRFLHFDMIATPRSYYLMLPADFLKLACGNFLPTCPECQFFDVNNNARGATESRYLLAFMLKARRNIVASTGP